MTAVQVAERMTAEEFLALPECEETRGLELIDGEVVVNEPTPLHNFAVQELFYALKGWSLGAAGRGGVWLPLDVPLDERTVVAPDLLWYSEARNIAAGGESASPLPDLAIEVRSPSTWRYDVGAKKSAYERHGLPELWLVDTAARQVLAFRRTVRDARAFDVSLELEGDDVLSTPLLPGFSLRIDAVFPRGR